MSVPEPTSIISLLTVGSLFISGVLKSPKENQ
ncbi:PEP-CTERM sorting domain-containing protein [Roseofilum casamattae]